MSHFISCHMLFVDVVKWSFKWEKRQGSLFLPMFSVISGAVSEQNTYRWVVCWGWHLPNCMVEDTEWVDTDWRVVEIFEFCNGSLLLWLGSVVQVFGVQGRSFMHEDRHHVWSLECRQSSLGGWKSKLSTLKHGWNCWSASTTARYWPLIWMASISNGWEPSCVRPLPTMWMMPLQQCTLIQILFKRNYTIYERNLI